MNAREFAQQWHDSKEFIEVMTSGSTGEPKVIRLYKKDMRLSAIATNDFFGLGVGARYVCPMDFRFVGAKMMYVRAQMSRGELVEAPVSRKFEFDGFADLLAVTPAQVDAILRDKDMAQRIRCLIIGGGALSQDRAEAIIKCGIRAYITYGMTETASHIALSSVGNTDYTVLPGIEISVDHRGCLVVDMPGRITDHVVTNDLVYLTSPKTFRWLGRSDNVINSGGIKINPVAVEQGVSAALSELGIESTGVVVFGIPDALWGQKAVCIVESDVVIPLGGTQSIRDAVKSKLDDSRKCPSDFYFRKKLPRTDNGKLVRNCKILRTFVE